MSIAVSVPNFCIENHLAEQQDTASHYFVEEQVVAQLNDHHLSQESGYTKIEF